MLPEEKKIISGRRWLFLILILATIIVPQIIANQYNTDFAFGYPIGGEYQMAKAISAIFSLFIIFYFLKKLPIKISPALNVLIGILSLVPLFRLAIGSLFFLTDQTIDKPSHVKYLSWDGVKASVIVGIGFYSLYLFIFSLSDLIFLYNTESLLINLSRLIASGLVLFFILRRKNEMTQANVIEYLILVFLAYLFVM